MPLAKLTQLTRLDISYNRTVQSFAFLRKLTALKMLNVTETNLCDVSVCRSMTELQELSIGATAVDDCSSLNHLVHLQILTGAEL